MRHPAALACAAALAGLAALPAAAEEAERYRLERTEDGYVRLDTATGAMTLCREADGRLVCAPAAQESASEVESLRAARAAGALTIGIAGTPEAPLLQAAEHAICLPTGPEVIAGSTRMKAGTAQKVALNLISTQVMVRMGRVHAGQMVDMRPANAKLRTRARGMVMQLGGADSDRADAALAAAGGRVKPAVLIARGLSAEAAMRALADCDDNLRRALEQL